MTLFPGLRTTVSLYDDRPERKTAGARYIAPPAKDHLHFSASTRAIRRGIEAALPPSAHRLQHLLARFAILLAQFGVQDALADAHSGVRPADPPRINSVSYSPTHRG